jgi:hypothetical protein
MKIGFFAYSSYPRHSETCVEEAIKRVNEERGKTCLHSWKECSISGELVIHNVIKAIDDADFFCADLTGMSNNVLFELGYAIAKKKNIFLIFDKSHEDSVYLYQNLTCLNGLAYSRYSNSEDVYEHLSARMDGRRKKRIPTSLLVDRVSPRGDRKAVLYLKSQVNTEYSRRISQRVKTSQLPYIIDDRAEIGIPSLSWYKDQLSNVPAVLVEFSSMERGGYKLHNAKCSIVAGLAYGLGLDLLMVVEDPYNVPIDYRELLVKSSNPETLEEVVYKFLESITSKAFTFITSQKSVISSSQENRNDLQNITFGQIAAESEGEQVSQYYLNVWNLNTLIAGNYKIIIGRKGVGKTATLKSLKASLEENRQNCVCVIEPVPLDVEDLLYLLRNLLDHEKTHLVESTWKFLIYTNIVNSLYNRITQRKRHISAYTQAELNFSKFVQQNEDIFQGDLSERFKNAAKKLKIDLANADSLRATGNFLELKEKISEILHVKIISDIKNQLAKLFESDKLSKVVVLIDNLDKAWKPDSRFDTQSLWILGLLNVADSIVWDLSKIRSQSALEITFNLAIFLRSDIFKYIQDNCPEPDKLNRTYLKWNDQETLFRAIDKRIVALNEGIEEETFWQTYIVESVYQEPIKEYIFKRILPRPRDLIYFLDHAMYKAASAGHIAINEKDIEDAYENYSNWVASLMSVEIEPLLGEQQGNFSNFLLFLGKTNIICREEILSNARRTGFSFKDDEIDRFIDYLVSISVIGRETKPNEFEYEYDFDSKDRLKILAMRLDTNRFRIHNALVPYLRCQILD